ncbi:MAG TPA: hypothetical protein VER12_16675 [Polyangiaceae bacterium]|nr:hypothetical protein [Polyangiaceae bacterium]
MRRFDSARRDAVDAYSRAEIIAQLADGGVPSQSLAASANEPRIEADLSRPELLTRLGKRIVDVVVDARMEPNRRHSTEWTSARA